MTEIEEYELALLLAKLVNKYVEFVLLNERGVV